MNVLTNTAWLSPKQKLASDPALLARMMDYDHPALKERMACVFYGG